MDNMMNHASASGYFNGSIALIEKGKVIYTKSFGYSDFTKRTFNDSQSIYELASVSKQFTAMAIMMLKEQGKLNYQDSLRKFLPELPYSNITIRQLLNHTSGLPDYLNEIGFQYWDSEKIYTNEDAIAELARHKLPVHFKPGEKFEYCNTGYMLLASIVAQVSGETFENFIKKYIFLPLGMNHSGIFTNLQNQPNYHVASGFIYDIARNQFELPENIPNLRIVRAFGGTYGDGGIGSTITDQIKWHQSLITGKLVSREAWQEAITSGSLNDGTLTGYGFGWFIQQDPDDGKIIQHTGGWAGVRNAVVRWLNKDRVLIILRNNEIEFRGIQEAVKNILDGKPWQMPKPSMAQVLARACTTDDPQGITDKYNELKGDKAYLNEEQINQLGYQLLEAGKIKSAVEVLRINTELFPQSANAFDSLGEAYLKAGSNELAKTSYSRSLELNSQNENVKKVLSNLGGN